MLGEIGIPFGSLVGCCTSSSSSLLAVEMYSKPSGVGVKASLITSGMLSPSMLEGGIECLEMDVLAINDIFLVYLSPHEPSSIF